MTLRLLAIGDIHLGRRPSGVPADVAASAGGIQKLGPRKAWSAAVQAALDEKVDAVLLLGDVVDDEDHYLEGWSELVSGCSRLVLAQIEVLAIAGNHDVRVLPRLCETVPGLRLLGAGGRWEVVELRGQAARIVGWSYPRAHAATDPTADAELARLLAARGGGPTIALLHGDLDAPHSDYAHFRSRTLEALGAEAWLLGHIHAPSFVLGSTGSVSMGYLGSITGLDPTETGSHGPWRLDFEGRRLSDAHQVAVAPLRWERLEVSVESLASIGYLEGAITAAIVGFEEHTRAELGAAHAIGLRIVLVGRTPFHKALATAVREFDRGSIAPTLNGRRFFVETIRDEARPTVDLQTMARDDDPPGLLARRLLALEQEGEAQQAVERQRLVRTAREVLERLANQPAFAGLSREVRGLSEEQIVDQLRAAGLRALEEILAQRPKEDARA